MSETKVKLQYPVTDADGEVFEELIIRRPIVKDLRAIDETKGDIAKIAVLIERLATSPNKTAMTSVAVNRIDAEDFATLGDIVGSFLEKSPQTGEK